MRRPNAKRKEKIQPVAIPLDTLPESRTMTIHPEISARGSLIPAGDGCFRIPVPSGQDSEGGKKSAHRSYETDPFPNGSSVPPYYFD